MPRQRIMYGLEALAVIVVVGSLGYMVIEDVTFFSAFYMVVISITTVGFAEVFELSDVGRIWTLIILVTGFGIAIYTAVASFEYIIDLGEFRRRRRMQNQAGRLNNHVIICGFGRVGRGTWAELTERDIDVVVTLTDDEETNILSSLLARRMGARKAITKISKFSYFPLMTAIGIEQVVSTRLSAINSILQHIRRGKVLSAISLKGEQAEGKIR